jgi:REP element-mobilizing transposase RayT
MPQSLAKVYIHLIFSTKNRAPLLADDWRDELFRVLGGAANNLGCQSLIVGGVADHVHMLFQLGRTISIADAVGKIKSTSSCGSTSRAACPRSFIGKQATPPFQSASRTLSQFAGTSFDNRNIMPHTRFKTNYASGCNDTKQNGTNATCGIDARAASTMNGPFRANVA